MRVRRILSFGAWLVSVALCGATVAAQKPGPGTEAPKPARAQAAHKSTGAAEKAAEAAPKPAASADVQVRTALDRTAVWVADPVTYTVTITCTPGFDVLDDDLARDKIKLDGLEVVSTNTSREQTPTGATVRTFAYHLTTYKVDQRALTIGPTTVRYYKTRAGQGIENAAPAGEVQVPGAVIAFRSMLPEDQDAYPLRDGRTAGSRPRLMAAARPVGTALVLIAIVPALFWVAGAVRERRPKKERRSMRQVQEEERTSLDAVRAIDLTTADGRREAYTKINTLVREHLLEVSGVPGPSLTGSEVEPALAGRPSRVPAETVAALLTACETARYGPPTSLPPADACRDAIEQAAQVLAAR